VDGSPQKILQKSEEIDSFIHRFIILPSGFRIAFQATHSCAGAS
jgi:hypothetical protein